MAYNFLDKNFNSIGVLTNTGGQLNSYWGDQITHSIATSNDVLTSVSLSIDKATKDIDTNGNQKEWNHTIQGLSFGIDGIGKDVNELNYVVYQDGDQGHYYLMTITQVDESLTTSGFHFKTIQGINSAAYDLSRKTLKPADFAIVPTGTQKTGSVKNILNYVFSDLGWDVRVIGDFPAIEYTVSDSVSAQSVLQDVIKLFDAEVDAHVLINNLSSGSNVFTGAGSIKRVFEFSTAIGNDNGDVVRLNRNLVSLTKTGARDSLYTKLYVTGNDIDIAPANNGANFIYDDNANMKYNSVGANSTPVQYLEGVINNSDIKDPQALLTWGKKQLKALNHPRYNYTVTSVDGKNVHLGDDVIVQDLKASQPIILKSKIISKTISFADPQTDSFILGEFSPIVIPTKNNDSKNIVRMINKANQVAMEANNKSDANQKDLNQLISTSATTNLIVDSSLVNKLSNWISTGNKQWYYTGLTMYNGVASIGVNSSAGQTSYVSSQYWLNTDFSNSSLYYSFDFFVKSSSGSMSIYLIEANNKGAEISRQTLLNKQSSVVGWTNIRGSVTPNPNASQFYIQYEAIGAINGYISRPYVGVSEILKGSYVAGEGNNNSTVLELLDDNFTLAVKNHSGDIIAGINADTSGTTISGNKIILDGNVRVTGDFDASTIVVQGLKVSDATIGKTLTIGVGGSIGSELDTQTLAYEVVDPLNARTNSYQYNSTGNYKINKQGITITSKASFVDERPAVNIGGHGYNLTSWTPTLYMNEGSIKMSGRNIRGTEGDNGPLESIADANLRISPFSLSMNASNKYATMYTNGFSTNGQISAENLIIGSLTPSKTVSIVNGTVFAPTINASGIVDSGPIRMNGYHSIFTTDNTKLYLAGGSQNGGSGVQVVDDFTVTGGVTINKNIDVGWDITKNGTGFHPAHFNNLPGIHIQGSNAGIAFDEKNKYAYFVLNNTWYRIASSASGSGSWDN